MSVERYCGIFSAKKEGKNNFKPFRRLLGPSYFCHERIRAAISLLSRTGSGGNPTPYLVACTTVGGEFSPLPAPACHKRDHS